MSFGYTAQAIDLAQPPPFEGYDVELLEREGLINEVGSINFAALIDMCISMGNAYTSGLAMMANVFCEPEWGFDTSGLGGGNYSGRGGQSAVGGSTIWW